MISRRLVLRVISVARRYFRNTVVHRWRITGSIYRIVFRSAFRNSHEEIIFRGSRFVIDTRDISIAPTVITGEYESKEFEVLEKLLSMGMNFVDVGAHIGLYSVLAAKAVGPDGKVWAFEPVPRNFELLRQNISLNDLRNVTPVQSAVADRGGRTRIYLSPSNTGTHSGLPLSEEFVEVDCVTLDSLDSKIHVLKIDVEGFEGAVLLGARNLIKSCRPIIFLEFLPQLLVRSPHGPDMVLSVLEDNYQYLYAIDEKHGTFARTDKEKLKTIKTTNLVASTQPIL